MMIAGKLKVSHIGTFEFHNIEELEKLVSDKDSMLRRKLI